jgi:hypothetical protein
VQKVNSVLVNKIDSKHQSPSKLYSHHSCDSIYNIPDNKSLRKTSFGFGKKTDLDYGKHRHNKSPPPDKYQIDSFVDFNKTHMRGSSCHIGREVFIF